MSDENENLSNAETQLLLRLRLNMEDEFKSGRKKKNVLWKKVLSEIKNVNPHIRLDSTTAQRKFLNLLVTYKRIKKINNSSGREATSWRYFEDFDEVYGTRHSITPPIANLQASLDLVPSTSPTSSSEVNGSPDSPPTSSQRATHPRATSNKDILKFFEAEAVKEEARHNEVMAMEREKLSLEKERIKALLDMKSVLADYLKK
ncbi:uncharacterized protein LOC126765352 [Bactrocera neohumeralis]|uniref:uncharacterized protein LOC126765352 n=1 Tax=Bactrocera neohumeralis TaxID=98809 RepID=UPI0021665FB5|nr:uncharacterized protein LOC126765352 [Bactrocera neohumeralis]